jgi:hypothetical protein
MADGFFNIPPRELEVPSHWCYIEQVARNGEIGESTYGIMTLQNSINFRPAIFKL